VVLDDDADGVDETPLFEHPFSATPTAPAPRPVRNVRLDSTTPF
jgi:hypothetical protein